MYSYGCGQAGADATYSGAGYGGRSSPRRPSAEERTMASRRQRALVIGQDQALRRLVGRALREAGVEVAQADAVAQGIAALGAAPPS